VDGLALGDGAVAEVAGEGALDDLTAHVDVSEPGRRGEGHPVGVLDVDGTDGDGVADLHAGVRAGVGVDEDGAVAGVDTPRPHLRDGGAFAADLDGVAAEEAELLAGGFGEPSDASARVPLLGGTHREPEAGGLVHAYSSGCRPFTVTRLTPSTKRRICVVRCQRGRRPQPPYLVRAVR